MSNFQAIPGEDIQRLIDHSAVRRAAAEHYKNVIKLNLQAYIASCENCIAMYDAVIKAETETLEYLTNVLKQEMPKPKIEAKDMIVEQDEAPKKQKRTENPNGKHNEQSNGKV